MILLLTLVAVHFLQLQHLGSCTSLPGGFSPEQVVALTYVQDAAQVLCSGWTKTAVAASSVQRLGAIPVTDYNGLWQSMMGTILGPVLAPVNRMLKANMPLKLLGWLRARSVGRLPADMLDAWEEGLVVGDAANVDVQHLLQPSAQLSQAAVVPAAIKRPRKATGCSAANTGVSFATALGHLE